MSQVADLIKGVAKNVTDVQTRLKSLDELEGRVKKIEAWGERAAIAAEKIAATPKGEGSEEARFGFKSFGHFANEIKQAGITKRMTPTLEKAYASEMVIKAAAGMGETVGSDGGFLVPPEFSNKIFERVYDNDLLKRCDMYTVSGNTLTFPRNSETSRANGSRFGGVRGYWAAEGDTATASRPKFGTFTLKLHKLIAISPVTEELLQDSATALETYLFRCFTDEINFLVGDALMNGTGAGQPVGMLNAACTISVSKETGQSAATINTQNVVKMWARMWAPSRANAVWFINQDIESQLYTMTLGVGTAGVVTYMPPGGLSQAPYATLMGRPVIPTEFNATLGTVGDIVLADLSQMVAISKGGVNNATSMHLYFATDEQAFRSTFRVDAQPWWSSALTPFKGSATQSPFITLATRS